MDLQLTGRRALVTGSNSGISAGITRVLAAGPHVIAPESALQRARNRGDPHVRSECLPRSAR